MSVIVTNAKSRVAYNIVKSLGKMGINVITSDFIAMSMSFYSKYSKHKFIYPSPYRINNDEFVKCMIENIHRYKAKVLIPVSEETFIISKYKDELSKHVGLVVPSYDKILLTHNKDKWGAIAKKLNINVPDSFDLNEMRENLSVIYKITYPVLIKPKQGGGGWGITVVTTPRELENLLMKERYFDRKWDRFYLQRKIEGETHCVAMLFNKGLLRAKVAYKQLREYPLTCGQATLRVSLSSPKAEMNLQALLEHLVWHGICQADFVIDKLTGTPYLVDLNPRFWGSLVQGIASGVNFPHLYYKIAIGDDVKPVLNFKTAVMTRWIGGDLCAFIPHLKEANNKVEFIKQFICPADAKISKDDFSWDDPLPFIAWVFDTLSRAVINGTTKPVSHEILKGIWE